MQQFQTPQQGGQQQTGFVMPEPPVMVSTKDHLYLKDAMSWELVAMKKYRHFANECADPELKAAFDRAGSMHQRHYLTLLNHVQPRQGQTF
jgi:rubrerythrin